LRPILTILGKNWPKNLEQKFCTALFPVIWGVAGLRPNFFSSGRIFLAELAQEYWRDLAAVIGGGGHWCANIHIGKKFLLISFQWTGTSGKLVD
jgi:hypothetical protein